MQLLRNYILELIGRIVADHSTEMGAFVVITSGGSGASIAGAASAPEAPNTVRTNRRLIQLSDRPEGESLFAPSDTRSSDPGSGGGRPEGAGCREAGHNFCGSAFMARPSRRRRSPGSSPARGAGRAQPPPLSSRIRPASLNGLVFRASTKPARLCRYPIRSRPAHRVRAGRAKTNAPSNARTSRTQQRSRVVRSTGPRPLHGNDEGGPAWRGPKSH